MRAYGCMLVLSFVVGSAWACARGRRAGIDPRTTARLCLVILLTAAVGARLLYVGEDLATYWAEPARIPRLWEGGLSMYGGVGLALLASLVFARAIDVPFLAVADVCAPALALGEALTRVGCFLNGCCFGIPSALPWAVTFPHASPAGHVHPDTALHPTQLYAAVYSLGILAVLLLVERRRPRPGLLIALFLVLQAAGRFGLELVRHHGAAAEVAAVAGLTLTSHQIISLVLLALGTVLVFVSSTSEVTHGRPVHCEDH